MASKSDKGQVYAMKYEIFIPGTIIPSIYKIGKALNSFERVTDLKKEQACIGIYTIEAVYETDNMSDLEKFLHQKLETVRIRGHKQTEFFNTNLSMVKVLVDEYVEKKGEHIRVKDVSSMINDPLKPHNIMRSYRSGEYDDWLIERTYKAENGRDTRGTRRQRIVDIHNAEMTVGELKERIKKRTIMLSNNKYYKNADLKWDFEGGWLRICDPDED